MNRSYVRRHSRVLIAIIIPLIALGIQWTLWKYISPFVWFLFFPAVFLCARIGGWIGGLLGTALSVCLVWYFFIPYQLSFKLMNPYNAFSMAMFAGMGYLFSSMQARLDRANGNLKKALEESRKANEKISSLYNKIFDLDKLKSRFFANISHELRTPLTLITGTIKKVRRNIDDGSDNGRDLEIAERNARFLHRHVNDLLDISKLESGRMTLNSVSCDLARVTRNMASQFDTLAAMRNMIFSVDLPPVMPAVLDVEKFQRILLNLLSNAFKFTPNSGTITVVLRKNDEGIIQVHVSDSGPGIPENQRKLVFERFSQMENPETRKHGGTGLGLSIVREFAELLGGSVSLGESIYGGACFSVTFSSLPVQEQSAPRVIVEIEEDIRRQAVDELMPPKEHAAFAQSSPELPLVLIVEDNRDMNSFIAEGLSGDYRVASAFDGDEGYVMAVRCMPDLIIADEMMPVYSGSEMAERMSADNRLSAVPVIMLTAKADDELRVQAFHAGVRDFISKPFEMDELILRVRNILAASVRSRAALEISEKKYRILAENVVDVVWVMDAASGEYLYISPSIERMRGYPASDITHTLYGQTLTDEISALLKCRIDSRINEFAEGIRTEYIDEFEFPRRDGSFIWGETSSRFVRNEETGRLEIFGVTRDITSRKKMEMQLKHSLGERDTLIKELYHRTKNNMNVIIGMLALRVSSEKNPAITEVFADMENKIRAMSLVHEKLYRSRNLTHIYLDEYFDELIRILLVSFSAEEKGVRFLPNLNKVLSSLDAAVPCGLILNELVSNSMKHAFDGGGGEIALSLSIDEDNRIRFVYSDNGKGFSAGYSMQELQTLGMRTIMMIAEHQLIGSAVFDAEQGVRCTVVFENKD